MSVHGATQSPAAATRSLSSEEFREVIGHFASGVTVITAVSGDQRAGTTASAVCSLSMDPPMVLVCMNRSSETGMIIDRSRSFAINILCEDQEELASHFARKAPDKFASVAATTGDFGQPLLDAALAHLECAVTECVTAGTHTVFLAEVRSATAHPGTPLAYFRGKFGRLDFSPATAPQHVSTAVNQEP